MSYLRLRDSSDIFTCDIHVARQSVVDIMVREISLKVREKSWESQGIYFHIFGGNHDVYINSFKGYLSSWEYCT